MIMMLLRPKMRPPASERRWHRYILTGVFNTWRISASPEQWLDLSLRCGSTYAASSWFRRRWDSTDGIVPRYARMFPPWSR